MVAKITLICFLVLCTSVLFMKESPFVRSDERSCNFNLRPPCLQYRDQGVKDFWSAVVTCEEAKGKLLRIDSQSMQRFVEVFLKERLLNRLGDHEYFASFLDLQSPLNSEAADGNVTLYTNWVVDHGIVSSGGDMKCAVITRDFTWKPSVCRLTEDVPVICMHTPTESSFAEEACDHEQLLCLNHFGFQAHDIQSAAEHCKLRGGALVEIKSWETQRFVEQFLSKLIKKYFMSGRKFASFIDLRRKDSAVSDACATRKFSCISSNEIVCEEDRSLQVHDCFVKKGITLLTIGYLNWFGASRYCQEKGGGSLLDDGTMEPVWEWLSGVEDERKPFVLATTRIKWSWSDGSNFTSYSNWNVTCTGANEESQTNNMKCAVITGDFVWKPSWCRLKEALPVVCMKRISRESITFGLWFVLAFVFGTALAILFLGVACAALRRARGRSELYHQTPRRFDRIFFQNRKECDLCAT